jgi:glycosyltransferase involved in cell wall biosynthesis
VSASVVAPGGRGRVCFYSEYAYPLLVKSTVEFAGGSEALVARLARGLAARGYDVTLVTCDYGQPPVETRDGVRVLRAFRPGRGIRGLRFFHPRLTLATAALFRADADVYYVCGSGMSAGLTCDVAKLRGAGFVLAMMTDYDVMPKPPADSGSTMRHWYLHALARADHVLSQTMFQQTELRRCFGVSSEVFPNIVDIPPQAADPGSNALVLWLATYKATKRPEWFLRLAKDLPDHRFVMAGIVPPPPLTRESWEQASTAARDLPNLEVNGFLPDATLAALRRRAALVVHTSPVEGFSNVLLEAWAEGIPTVSGVDPDGLVTREGIGRFAPDYETLLASVHDFMASPESRREAGARARRYAETHHAPAVVLDTLERVLDPIIARIRRRRGTA